MRDHVFDKDSWRSTNLKFLRSVPALWDEAGKLKYSYLELVGRTGSEMFELLSDRLHSPRQFIGVDWDRAVILSHRRDRVMWASLRSDDGYTKAYEISQFDQKARLEAGLAQQPLAVFGFDDQTGMDKDAACWESRQLRNLVRSTLCQSDVCVMVLNSTLDAHRIGTRESFVRYTRQVCEVFKPWGLEPDRLLGYNAQFLDRLQEGTLGWLGPYQIYRSRGRKSRMCTLRLSFSADRVWLWRPG